MTGVFRAGRARRVARLLLAVSAGLLVIPAAPADAQVGPGEASAQQVTSGPPDTLGEPAATQYAHGEVIAATTFAPEGAEVRVWVRAAGASGWTEAGSLLPTGFASSYDPAVAALPDGAVLVVAVAAGEGRCIVGGSVVLARVSAQGLLGPASTVVDERGTGYFDDRPTVTADRAGNVWLGWSRGPDADACQPVGAADLPMLAASHDSGASFSAPMLLAPAGSGAAFGVRLAVLGAGRVAAGWTLLAPDGEDLFELRVVDRGVPGPLERPVDAPAPPLVLPGASFYDFPVADLAALPGGQVAVALPAWSAQASGLEVAIGPPEGPWRLLRVPPPAGADLLLPAIAAADGGKLLLLCAVHGRAGDELGYAQTLVTAGGRLAPADTPLDPVTAAPAGPGFFEIGEELSFAAAGRVLLAGVVVAGKAGASLQTLRWTLPARPAASPSARPPARPAAGRGKGRPVAGTGRRAGGIPVLLIGLAGAGLALLLGIAGRAARRRGRV